LIAPLYAIIVVLAVFSISTLTSSFLPVSGNQSNWINSSSTTKFTDNLESRIQSLVSDALNNSGNLFNSSSNTFLNNGSSLSSVFLNNNSNQSSNQMIISSNKIISSISNNGSGESNSLVKDKITTVNGVCNSEKIAGNGNDTLLSSGNCNDELTGGAGADKFTCGEGNDTIRDFNPKEGDVILDKQNCEKIL
jgi:Ca2+-binding RTX toxin-like protein